MDVDENVVHERRRRFIEAWPDLEEVVWVRTGPWRAQHDPTVLPNGNILLFDNLGHGGQSKVIEFDPVTGEVHWLYAGNETGAFFTKAGGACQRLPNGNTLITESDNGHAFEVTPDGEIVWEYRNPERAGEGGELMATIFEMIRLPADTPLDWLPARQRAPRITAPGVCMRDSGGPARSR